MASSLRVFDFHSPFEVIIHLALTSTCMDLVDIDVLGLAIGKGLVAHRLTATTAVAAAAAAAPVLGLETG